MWEGTPFLPGQKSQGSWRPLSCMVQGEGATKQKMERARRGEGKERRRQRTSMHQRRPLQLQLKTRTVTVTLRENVSPSAQDSRRHHPAKDLAPSHWPCTATRGGSEGLLSFSQALNYESWVECKETRRYFSACETFPWALRTISARLIEIVKLVLQSGAVLFLPIPSDNSVRQLI